MCPDCLAELPRRPSSSCPICALPAHNGGPCGQCLRDPPHYDATWAVFDYVFPVNRLVQALKYGHQLSVATYFAAELRTLAEPRMGDVDLILPMPLHLQRLADRGFNQAVELARPLAQATGCALELASVSKVRNTPAQASLGRDERLLGPRGVFACERTMDGLHVLVVDDVMTTGATLNELARCLKQQGARRVTNLVVARTPAPA